VEHRLFSAISMKLATDAAAQSYEVIVQLIGATTTAPGSRSWQNSTKDSYRQGHQGHRTTRVPKAVKTQAGPGCLFYGE